MGEGNPRPALVAAAILGLPVLAYLTFSHLGYFTQPAFIGGLLILECLLAAVWFYRQVFFPLVLMSFLLAGVDLPVGGGWNIARWVFLGAGALVGSFIMLKDRGHHFGLFHILAAFSVLAATVSAAVSRYPEHALLKAFSLFLLFAYASTGARLSVIGRESRFFTGLVVGCEVFITAVGGFYFLGIEMMGNPNSLGAVACVSAPILLWGILVEENSSIRRRRWVVYTLCVYLTFHSEARAGMAAAVVSCGLLCFGLRKYRMLAQGTVIILIFVATSAIVDPAGFSDKVSSLTASIVYKGKDPNLGVLGSRMSPWQAAMDSIRAHFWFGTGFGTSDNGQDASEHVGNFSSNTAATAENGSSFLAITSWVGVGGVLPFVLLLFVLLGKVARTLIWMRKTGNACHPAIPLAMVVVAGLVHATFEDWLFAVGYYLCVFFWSLALVLVDVAPSRPLPEMARFWQPAIPQQKMGSVVPSQ
jgi:O-antigen ligase